MDHSTPRRVRIAVRQGRMRVLALHPKPSPKLSTFQRSRLRRSFFVVSLYLVEGKSTEEIAQKRKCKHQRISQILKLGIDYLIETGRIVEVDAIAA